LNGSKFPQFISDTVDIIESQFGARCDTAVMKRYQEADKEKEIPAERSDAFRRHKDPKKYRTAKDGRKKRIVVLSLTGLGYLTTEDDFGRDLLWECVPNSALGMPAHINHFVSEPVPEFGPRGIIFFGEAAA
jgi:hypothetical protein